MCGEGDCSAMAYFKYKRRVIHYELILLYTLGFRPIEVIKRFGYRKSTAYKFNAIFRDSQKKLRKMLISDFSVSPQEEKKVNNHDV